MNVMMRIFGCLLGLALIAGFLPLGAGPAQAQEEDNDHVDVGLMLEFPDTPQAPLSHELNIVVVNHGSRTAYDVEIVVDVVKPEDSSLFLFAPAVPVGEVSLEDNGYTLRWSIPELRGLQREEVTARVYHKILASHMIGSTFDNSLIPHEVFGEATTSSFESGIHGGNNTSRVVVIPLQYNQWASNTGGGELFSRRVSRRTVSFNGGHRQFHHHHRLEKIRLLHWSVRRH